MKILVSTILSVVMIQANAFAKAALEEFNPFDPRAEKILEEYDAVYERETGLPAHVDSFESILDEYVSGCSRQSCRVWIVVSKAEQTLYLYVDGYLKHSWLVSTGRSGFDTPDFDRHPNGRMYTAHTSSSYPEGDYMGLGNMPYSIFISGGFALHGTPQGNWAGLGSPASHGCIRQHPQDAKYLMGLVRSVGVRKTWITVQ